jgi:hypothetical protein
MSTQFRGPLGIWAWPLVNIILSWITTWSSATQKTVAAAPSASSKAKNIEVWEWEDYRGRKRSITVHRTAEVANAEGGG